MNLKEVVPIWWAWQWRVVVAVVLANLAFGFILGVVGALLGLSKESLFIISNLLSLVITIYASIYFLAYVFEKFRIYVPKELGEFQKAAIK